jgi:hypothetical protein
LAENFMIKSMHRYSLYIAVHTQFVKKPSICLHESWVLNVYVMKF